MSLPPPALLEALASSVDRVTSIDLVALEGMPSRAVHAEVEPVMTSALGSLIETLGRVLDRYEGMSPEWGMAGDEPTSVVREFERGVDALVEQAATPDRVADLAFMATLELRQRQARIAGLDPDDDPCKLLAAFDSARRRAQKSARAVGTVLAELEGLDHDFGHASELTKSLAVRAVYAKLRRRIDADDEPSLDQLEARLRRIGTELVIMAGKPLYRDLRIEDRVEFRKLRNRIMSWVADPDRSAVDGLRLWQDIAAFGGILAQVSQRQELLQHDAVVLAVASTTCREGRRDLSEPMIEHLRSLRGLSDDVDRLLEIGERSAHAWCPVVDALALRFRRRPSAAPAQPEPAWLDAKDAFF
ncbi:MAG: hypothetical protein KC619_06020 [Myxococcales bacterium]|nr:hypothetical protein [Myxococcales bacterium]